VTASTDAAARPIPAARIPADERLVWRHEKSGVALADGTAMTAQEALQYARAEIDTAHDFICPARNLIGWTSGFGRLIRYVGEYPMPADPHSVIAGLDLLDVRLTEEQGYLLIRALKAAVDGTDPGPALLQLLALGSQPGQHPDEQETS
jgi:hypothetical protein